MKVALQRLKNLLREPAPKSPVDVFDAAVARRAKRYADLRAVVVECLYLRKKASAEVEARRAEVARLHHAALVAERRGGEARDLRRARDRAQDALSEAESEAAEIRGVAAEALAALTDAGGHLKRLDQERQRADRLRRLDDALGRLDTHGLDEDPALEAARHAIEAGRAQRRLEAELGG